MDRKIIEDAIARTNKLLSGVQQPFRSLAFPVVLTQVLQGRPSDLEAPKLERKRRTTGAETKPTRSAVLRQLIEEDWFKTERTLADIRQKLRYRGLPTKVTTMPSLVLPLVLAGRLKRKMPEKGKKEFVYFS